MAISMSLYCAETKLALWIGDWREWLNPYGFQLFSGETETMRALERFLAMHRGKMLMLCNAIGQSGEPDVTPDDAVDFTEDHWRAHVEQQRLNHIAQYKFDPEWIAKE